MGERVTITTEEVITTPKGKVTKRKIVEERESGFDVKSLPKPVQKAFKQSRVPKELYGDAYAVIGYALAGARDYLSDGVVSSNPVWGLFLSRDENFGTNVERVIDGIDVGGKRISTTQGDIKVLMRNVAANVNANTDLIAAVERQIEIVYDKYERAKHPASQRYANW